MAGEKKRLLLIYVYLQFGQSVQSINLLLVLLVHILTSHLQRRRQRIILHIEGLQA